MPSTLHCRPSIRKVTCPSNPRSLLQGRLHPTLHVVQHSARDQEQPASPLPLGHHLHPSHDRVCRDQRLSYKRGHGGGATARGRQPPGDGGQPDGRHTRAGPRGRSGSQCDPRKSALINPSFVP